MKFKRKSKKTETIDEPKKVKTVEVDGMTFKSRVDYNYFLKLVDYVERGLIDSFDESLFLLDVEHKYRAIKTTIDDIQFDSRLEADFYLYALELKKEGKIKTIELQPSYILQPAFTKRGKKYRPIKYIADFKIFYTNGEEEIIDVKGMVTPDFAIKKKMFEYAFPELHLRVLKYKKSAGGWIEHDDDKKTKTKSKSKSKK